jgi:hypothetical protein
VNAGDARSTLLPDALERQTRAANSVAVEELSICPAEKLNSDREGEPSPSTATQRH